MSSFIVFTQDFLSKVRLEVPLHQIISAEVKLRRCGKDYLGCCPFHEERTASFRVFTAKNTYRCFGCGESGDVIQWIRRRHDLSFRDAVLRAAELAGMTAPTEVPNAQSLAKRQQLATLHEALTQAQRLFRSGLERSAAALTYLKSERGLAPETIERFGVGFVAKGVIDAMRRNVTPEVLNASGLASQSEANGGELYDRFRYRIMVPIQNEGGTVIGFAGRSLREDPNTPKYLNSPETELFHKSHELYGLHLAKRAIRRSLTAVVVEGYFDVLSLHQAGDERVVAPMGTAMTASQLRRLLAHANNVVFAFDGDQAGRRAALNAAAVFLREMKDSSTAAILVLPENEDPDSYVRKRGAPAWLSAIGSAKPLSEFLCDVLRDGLDTTLPESQVRAAEKATRFLGEIRHANIFKRALQKKFEDVIGIAIGQSEAPVDRMEDACPRPMR